MMRYRRVVEGQERSDREIKEELFDEGNALESKITQDCRLSYDGKYPVNNIISFIFYIITNFSLLNSCCLLL